MDYFLDIDFFVRNCEIYQEQYWMYLPVPSLMFEN